MIVFNFDWSDTANQLILVALAGLLVTQCGLLIRNTLLPARRKVIRLVLNLIFWLTLLGFVFQPGWRVTSGSTHALLVGDGVPTAFLQQVKDSLGIEESYTAAEVKTGEFDGRRFDRVTLVGQAVDAETLSELSRQRLDWIRYDTPDQVQDIHWKGVVREGAMQRISGHIFSSRKQWIKVNYGGRTLDSMALQPGENAFTLRFPAFAPGRTVTELTLNQRVLDTIRFFTQATETLRFQFSLSNPDFESKTLADWLGKKGHSVQMTTTLSKNISSSLQINAKANRPDVVITTSDNANNAVVKRALNEGKSILFINLTEPVAAVQAINRALGSTWKLRKIASEEFIPVGNTLNALPYVPVPALNQVTIPGYPAAVQNMGGKIGITLLSETYPLRLSGDSATYERLWDSILNPLRPSSQNNVEAEAPVFKSLSVPLRINKALTPSKYVRLASDTIAVQPSSINPLSWRADYRFPESGWQVWQDSLEVYVETDKSLMPVYQSKVIDSYIQAQSSESTSATATLPWAEKRMPAWVWLLLLLATFTALWAEPKFR